MFKVLLASVAGIAALSSGSGTSAADFYANKRLTILVNYAAGGPSDIEGRLFARYIAKHIPGKPTVIVQNMDGAGGMIGTRFLAEIGPKDGTMLGYLTGAAWNFANNPERFPVDFRSYTFVAYQPGTTVYFMRTDVRPGMKDAVDIAKAQDVVAGGLGAENSKDLLIRLALDLLGVKYKYVTGYQSSNTARLALERGEINFFSESPPSYRSVIEPGLVTNGTVVPIFYDPGWNGVSLTVPKQISGLQILPFHELYKKIKGKEPSGQLWEVYKTILAISKAMQRMLVFAPGVPGDAVEAMRAAVLELNKDEDYAADALKVVQFVPEYEAGPDTDKEVHAALTTTPEIKEFIARYVKQGEIK